VANKGNQIEGNSASAAAEALGIRNYIITVNNREYNVSVKNVGSAQNIPAPAMETSGVQVNSPVVESAGSAAQGTEVEAPTPGNIVKILVEVGADVTVDQPLVVMEAMKMESEVKSPCAGKVLAVHVASGDTVQAGDMLFTIG